MYTGNQILHNVQEILRLRQRLQDLHQQRDFAVDSGVRQGIRKQITQCQQQIKWHHQTVLKLRKQLNSNYITE